MVVVPRSLGPRQIAMAGMRKRSSSLTRLVAPTRSSMQLDSTLAASRFAAARMQHSSSIGIEIQVVQGWLLYRLSLISHMRQEAIVGVLKVIALDGCAAFSIATLQEKCIATASP